jgi:[ribosomal protein S5]-alanine N-acetyltransferase
MNEIRTARLALVPITPEFAKATLEDHSVAEELIGARIPEDWPNPDFAEALPFIQSDLERDPSYALWTRVMVHVANRSVVGDAGFKSKPDDSGTVEIGYGVVPAHRNKGFAEEAAGALVEWGFTRGGVRCVVAECHEDNPASARVLEKLGMTRTGTESAESGTMIKWRLDRPTTVRSSTRSALPGL